MSSHETGSQKNRDAHLDFQKKEMQRHQQVLDEFAVTADRFFETGEPITTKDVEAIRKAKEYIMYADKEGRFSPSGDLYKIEEKMPFTSESLYNAGKRDKKIKEFYEIFSIIKNAWRFMRNSIGDTSDTVPGSLKREMVQREEELMRELADYYNSAYTRWSEITDEELDQLRESMWEKLQEVQQKANAYIAADMHVTANHMDKYERLLREMRRAVEGTEAYVDGNLVQLVLARMYSQEFEQYKSKYEEGNLKDLQGENRNRIVMLSNGEEV